jgi:hypothetical protein
VAGLLTNSNSRAAPLSEAVSSASTQPDLKQFVGTWTAMRRDLKLMVLELHLESGKLAGGIRTCSFTVDTEGTGGILEITDATLTKSLPRTKFFCFAQIAFI